jgi:pSer/pThr/pTyr-binding forkhead associated (FHA) protein
MSNDPSSKGSPDDQATVAGGVPVYKMNKTARPAVLRLVKGPGAPKDYVLDLDEVIVGRSQDAHVIIDSESVSRRHAAFERGEQGHRCRDLGSSNGVLVNATLVPAAELKDGDSVQIGDALFMYRAGS